MSILSPSGDGYFKTTDGSGTSYILDIVLNVLTYGIGIAAVFSLVISGIMYISSQGDIERVTKAKKRIIASMVGLICYAVMWAGLQFLLPSGIFTASDDDYTYGEGAKAQGELIVNDWKLTDDNRLVYCGANGQQVFGKHTVDGVELYFNDDGVVDLGGWDFTDWDYVQKIQAQVEASDVDGGFNAWNGTGWVELDNGWFIVIDGAPPCRMTVWRKVGNQWVAIAGWYTIVGLWSNRGTTVISDGEYAGTYAGGSTTNPGYHQLNTWYYDLPAHFPSGPVFGLVDYYESNGTYAGQAIHAGNGAENGSQAGDWGYGNTSCASLTREHADYLWNNMPKGTWVLTLNTTGIGGNVRLASPFGHDFMENNHCIGCTLVW